jgi:S-adenosylmethionine:tRNA ribosyltransferase-isomerase
MQISEFSYHLPQELIAQFPLENRGEARLLLLERRTGKIFHYMFYEIKTFFDDGDVLLLNNTKVFKARLKGKKETGGSVEILLIKKIEGDIWEAMLSHSRRIRVNTKIFLDNDIYAIIKEKVSTRCRLEFNSSVEKIIKKYGIVPLPHYIKRHTITGDEEYYQTIFAKKQGSIAAPTAGLHFTENILKDITKRGVSIAEITLHVGPGTFKAIRSANIEDHIMEAEYFEIPRGVVEIINDAKRIYGVGTSVCRAMESIALKKAKEYCGSTDLFIYPGYKFKIIDCLITNFHLPCSTPLLLACAFASKDLIFNAYKEAIKKKYRFLSYGDAMLIL